MANIIKRPGWYIPEKLVTPEAVFLNRRRFMGRLGLAGAGVVSGAFAGCSDGGHEAAAASTPAPAATSAAAAAAEVSVKGYPAARNAEFNPGWPLTNEKTAANYNNFYEFSTTKERVAKLVGKFVVSPWTVKIGGLVDKPATYDFDELVGQMTLEERVYRHRCVEAWAMIVPWTGFPLRKLLEKVAPKSEAKYVRFETFNRPDQAPGMTSDYPWPYTEGLTIAEAMNPLAMVVTGVFGKPLPKQHGAPIRIIVPWKYGYKSIKSIVKIDLVATEPATLWDTVNPVEYPFESNVNPRVPHPRWSQATERMIDTGDIVQTQIYNGYGAFVEGLYKKA